jgi:2-haloacid dehalogenase
VVVSGHERMAKPEIDFYNLLLERHDLDPARTLFIDDNDQNVQAARLAGLKAVTYTTPEALRATLVEHGLLEEGRDA